MSANCVVSGEKTRLQYKTKIKHQQCVGVSD